MCWNQYSIPVDVRNPGQVFACMGFLDITETLLGEAEAAFNWDEPGKTTFLLRTRTSQNPFECVLEFLANAEIIELVPPRYQDKKDADRKNKEESDGADDEEDMPNAAENAMAGQRKETIVFPSGEAEGTKLPILLVFGTHFISVSHWTDGSSRDDFKLYSGNRSAREIACNMLHGVWEKPKKHSAIRTLKYRGLKQLWQEKKQELLRDPFGVVTPMGGKFNFDARCSWTPISAGYSPNDQSHSVEGSPVVEILAAIGLENARPRVEGKYTVYYGIWKEFLPPMLAHAVFAGIPFHLPQRHFRFELSLSGKNKITTFAREENAQ